MNRLKELRKEKKLTLKQLSDELAKMNFKISADALGKYERGERKPKLDKAIAIAVFFDVPVSYLIGASDDKKYFTGNEDPNLILEQAKMTPLKEFNNLYMNPADFDGKAPNVELSNEERIKIVNLEKAFRNDLIGLAIPYIEKSKDNNELRKAQRNYLAELNRMVYRLDQLALTPLYKAQKTGNISISDRIQTLNEVNKKIKDINKLL